MAVVAVAGVAAAGIMVVTAAAGELDPRSVSVLALDYSGERWQRLPITAAAMTTTMVTPPMPVHPHPRFGIGAIPIRGITRRYPNARYRGDKLFSDEPECAVG